MFFVSTSTSIFVVCVFFILFFFVSVHVYFGMPSFEGVLFFIIAFFEGRRGGVVGETCFECFTFVGLWLAFDGSRGQYCIPLSKEYSGRLEVPMTSVPLSSHQ